MKSATPANFNANANNNPNLDDGDKANAADALVSVVQKADRDAAGRLRDFQALILPEPGPQNLDLANLGGF